MHKILTTLALTLAVLFGRVAVPTTAHATEEPTVVNVGSSVVPDPSLTGCDMGNGIVFVGDEHVSWTINGEPYEFSPQGRTLWRPNGFDGTVTATAEPGYELHEIATQRSGETLTWHHVVLPLGRACGDLVTCEQTRQQVVALTAKVERIQRHRRPPCRNHPASPCEDPRPALTGSPVRRTSVDGRA